MRGFLREIRYAIRGQLRQPAMTVPVMVTLGLAFGLGAAVYGVLYAVVLSPLPYENPETLVVVRHFDRDTGNGDYAASFPQFLDYHNRLTSFERIAAWREFRPTRTARNADAERVRITAATSELLPMLGVHPVIGRTFTEEDDRIGAPPTVLLSHAYWSTRFGGSPGVLGQTLHLDGVAHTVIGVLPAELRVERTGSRLVPSGATDMWIPYRASFGAEGMELRGLTNVDVTARLAPGVTAQAAAEEIDLLLAELAAEHAEHEGVGVRLIPALEAVTGPVRPAIGLLFGAGIFVLLIAATNVLTLVLGRAADRAREIAVRAALGAGRAALARQFFAESIVFVATGCGVGAMAATWTLAGLRRIDPGGIPRLDAAEFGLPTFVFLAGSALVVTCLLGLSPLLLARRSICTSAIRERSGVTVRPRLRQGLVVLQVALAALLLVGGGLLLRSLREVLTVEPGFDPRNILTVELQRPGRFVGDDYRADILFYRELLQRAAGLPGVESVAAAYQTPTDAGWNNSFRFATGHLAGETRYGAVFRPVSPGYFTTNGIVLREGRTFTASDDENAAGVVIVNEAFARRYFGSQSPVGDRLICGDFWQARPPAYEIVGVVSDVRFAGLTQPVPPATYFPHAQQPVRAMTLTVRAARDPLALAAPIRRLVKQLDPLMPVDAITTMEERLAGTIAERRFLTVLITAFSTIAAGLAAVGIYGVLALMVSRRRREIGVRVAIGAQPRMVMQLVLSRAVGLGAAGIGLGLVASLFAGRLLERFLFQVQPLDLPTLVWVAALLVGIAAAAAVVPTRRALRVDPVEVLRSE